MAGNTVRKIAPFIDTDIFAAESWLSDMAAKGLFFKEGAFWWNLVFEKGEPAKRRYRLVPAEPMELYTITTGEMSVYESAGWHYAGVYQGCSSRVFYTEDENAEEIYTDSEGLEFFYKRQRSKVLLSSVLMIALLIFDVYLFCFKGDRPAVLEGINGAGAIYILAGTVLTAIYAAASAANIISLKKKLKSGQISHDVKYSGRLIFGKAVTIALMVYTLLLILISIR